MRYWECYPHGSRTGKVRISIYRNDSRPVPPSRRGEDEWKQGGTLIQIRDEDGRVLLWHHDLVYIGYKLVIVRLETTCMSTNIKSQKTRTAPSQSWLIAWGTRLGLLILFIATCNWLDAIKVCIVLWYMVQIKSMFIPGPMVCPRTKEFAPARTGSHRGVAQQHRWND